MQNDVSPEQLLAASLDVWNSAKDGANTFCGQLLTEISSARALIKTGGISSVGKNSAHQSYKSREPGTPTQGQTVEIYVALLALFNRFKDQVTKLFTCSADFGNAVPAGYDFDSVIADPDSGLMTKTLLAMISGSGQLLPDITGLRLPACGLNPKGVLTW